MPRLTYIHKTGNRTVK